MRCIWSNYVKRESLRQKAFSENVCLLYFYSLLYCYIYNHYCFTHKLPRSFSPNTEYFLKNFSPYLPPYFFFFLFFFSFSLYNSISRDCPKLTLSCIPYVHSYLLSTCVLFFVICTKIVNRDRAVVNAVKAKLSCVKNVKFRKCVIDRFFFHVKTS